MNREDQDPNFGELDDFVLAALHVDVAPEQVERLVDFWRRESQVDRRRRHIRVSAAVATVAASLLVSTAIWFHFERPDVQQGEQRKVADNKAPVDEPHVAHPPTALGTEQFAHRLPASVRPANSYERFLFVARSQQRVESRQRLTAEAIDKLIVAMISDETADAHQLIGASKIAPKRAEQILLQRLERSDETRWRAILKLLCECGSERAIGPLLSLASRPVWCQQALRTIEEVAGAAGLAQAARQSRDLVVRQSIYRRLLSDESTVDVYLSLLRDQQLSDEVLSVADGLDEPIINALLVRLEAAEQQTRLAAAWVLGRANGPAVATALITFVSENRAEQTEAWIALLACRGPQVEQFLAYASHRPKLLGPINRARVYWARLVN